MSVRNREIESKWLVKDTDLDTTRHALEDVLGTSITKSIFGSSVDTYWVPDSKAEAQFVRMRERDGIRQITVKSRDKGSNINRLEVDVDSTSEVSKITRLLGALFGKAAGKVSKSYYVYWDSEHEHTNICAYTVLDGDTIYPHTIVELETTTMEKLDEMDKRIIPALRKRGLEVTRAPGSLFEMFVEKSV